MVVIYRLLCKTNSKVYIGITSDLCHRINVHKGIYTETLLSRAIRKYGWERFDFSIIEVVGPWWEACEKEKQYIKHFNSYMPNGYNMTLGGEGQNGLIHTEETKRKMSLSHIGKGVGKDNPMFGKPNPRKGCHLSKETRQKMSQAMKGRIPWNKGNTFSKYVAKGRIGCQAGEKHSQAKLSTCQIQEIRDLYFQDRLTQKGIGEIYNITQSQVSHVVNGKTWKHLSMDRYSLFCNIISSHSKWPEII